MGFPCSFFVLYINLVYVINLKSECPKSMARATAIAMADCNAMEMVAVIGYGNRDGNGRRQW
jgi:hypothetical protein